MTKEELESKRENILKDLEVKAKEFREVASNARKEIVEIYMAHDKEGVWIQ